MVDWFFTLKQELYEQKPSLLNWEAGVSSLTFIMEMLNKHGVGGAAGFTQLQ